MGMFDWFKSDKGKEVLADSVQAVSPILAGAIGSPIASLAIGLITKAVFGTDNTVTDPNELAKQLKNLTPDMIIKIKEAEMEFVKLSNEYKLQLVMADSKDTANARDMALKSSIKPQLVISLVFIIAYMFIFTVVLINMQKTSEINQMLAGAFLTMLSVLTTAIPQILSFWFGSNKSEQERSHSSNIMKIDTQRVNDNARILDASKIIVGKNKDAVD